MRPDTAIYEAEFLTGLAPFVLDELAQFSAAVVSKRRNTCRFELGAAAGDLDRMRTVVAVYRLLHFNIPRPRSLLGDQHLRRLLDSVTEVASRGSFSSFRFGAAGSHTRVFQRLGETLQGLTRLRYLPGEGDLLIRVRRGSSGQGWEVLLRLTPRPLSARTWRVCNLKGGLNATVAAAVNALLSVAPGDRYLNAMVGSGTLLVERGLAGPAERLVGCDRSDRSLSCARKNLAAADLADFELLRADATALPVADASFDAVSADLPWGDAVGRFSTLSNLYPAFLAEMWRVTVPHGRLAVITHDLKRFDAQLAEQGRWCLKREFQVYQGGHHPKIYLLERV